RRDKAPESDVENAKVMHPHKQQQQQEGETAEGSVAASAPDGMEHREDTSPSPPQQQEGETVVGVAGSVTASAPDDKEHREDTPPPPPQQQQENGNTESDAEEVKVLRSRDHRRREH
ncbi:hypothetical protein DQ04_27311000, partial [Trypanosoma grayi]|uniref:hypothetical protein n=1 Tax=Trypanosoma grayi TaxID=71804 RepID=UPI0004F45D85